MSPRPVFATHDEYFAAATPAARKVLVHVQALVEQRLSGAQRCISYGMPAYRMGKVFFFFAAFKHHLGIYPPLRHDATLIKTLAPYRNEKGNLAFPFKEPIPYELIGEVAEALAREVAGA